MVRRYKWVAVKSQRLSVCIATQADASFQLAIDRQRAFQISELPSTMLLDHLYLEPVVAYEPAHEKSFAVVAGFTSYLAIEELKARGVLPASIPILVVNQQEATRVIQSDLMRRLSALPHPKNAAVFRDEAKLLSPENARLFSGKVRASADALAKRFATKRQLFSNRHLKTKNRQPILSRLLKDLTDNS